MRTIKMTVASFPRLLEEQRKKNGIVALGKISPIDNKVRVPLPKPAGLSTQYPTAGVDDGQEALVLLDEPKHELVTSVTPVLSSNQAVSYAVLYNDQLRKFIPRLVTTGITSRDMDRLTNND